MMRAAERRGEAWHLFAIRGIEDLGNAILGAGLEAVRMAGPAVGGSLAFAAGGGIVWSSGRIEGNVLLRGPIADDAVTVGVLLAAGPGMRLGMRPVSDGTVAVVPPGDELDAYLVAGSLSRRTLFRAFATVYGETPHGFVLRLRLHRVRARLLAPEEPAATVVAAARGLGFDSDMGRLSARYRALFGEAPSATIARRRGQAGRFDLV